MTDLKCLTVLITAIVITACANTSEQHANNRAQNNCKQLHDKMQQAKSAPTKQSTLAAYYKKHCNE